MPRASRAASRHTPDEPTRLPELPLPHPAGVLAAHSLFDMGGDDLRDSSWASSQAKKGVLSRLYFLKVDHTDDKHQTSPQAITTHRSIHLISLHVTMPGRPFARIRSAAIDGRAQNPFFRRSKLKLLHEALAARAADIRRALGRDSGHTPAEVAVEFWLALNLIAAVHDAIDPDAVLADEYRVANGHDAPDAREPIGIVVLEPAAHTFLYSLASVLAPALGAGNCVIVQAEPCTREAPPLILSLVREALGQDIFEVSRVPVDAADVAYRHRRIFQNGCSGPLLFFYSVSDPQSRVVAVVERDADLDAAARALVTARFGLGGKSPYAPDLVLVNEWVKKPFLEAVARQTAALSHTSSVADVSSARGALQPSLVKEALREASGHVVSSTSSGAVIDVQDRYAPLSYT